jgi:hypothetical protein
MVSPLIEETRELCRDALRRPELRRLAASLAARGGPPTAWAVTAVVSESPQSQEPMRELMSAISGPETPAPSALEQLLLTSSALVALDKLPSLPVGDRVKALLCEEFRAFSCPVAREPSDLQSPPRFASLCRLATLRRFPAGQFHWEVSGIPRSYLLRVAPGSLPRTLSFVAARMGGLAPVFYSHLNCRRPDRSLSERESNRSYFQMAKALALQPDVKGFAACAWFRSPDTAAISPHLSWVNRVFLENGGLVVRAGRADPEGGVFYRSVTRRRLYEMGAFTPTNGLVLWPRRAMLAWAASHPEFAD